MTNNKQQTAVEWLIEDLGEYFPWGIGGIEYMVNQAKKMEKEQAQNYAEFCVMCDRENLPLLDFESYILTYGGNK